MRREPSWLVQATIILVRLDIGSMGAFPGGVGDFWEAKRVNKINHFLHVSAF